MGWIFPLHFCSTLQDIQKIYTEHEKNLLNNLKMGSPWYQHPSSYYDLEKQILLKYLTRNLTIQNSQKPSKHAHLSQTAVQGNPIQTEWI